MASKLFYKTSVEKDLRRIDRQTAKRIVTKLEKIFTEEAQPGVPLKGDFQGLFKYRIGDYRVIYTQIKDGILVLRIAHRKESYR